MALCLSSPKGKPINLDALARDVIAPALTEVDCVGTAGMRFGAV